MKFVSENSQIKCIRTMEESNLKKEVVVVTFGHQIERVPPHVAARLSEPEIAALDCWLEERSRLQIALEEAPIGKTILETLPALLLEATDTLDESEAMDPKLFKNIKRSLLKLARRLNDVHALTETEIPDLDTMQNSEVLKEQLHALKRNL
jgi:hypothetical protein